MAADDLTQETLIVICRKIEWLQDPAAFRAWAYRIAHRLAMKELRRGRRLKQLQEEHALRDEAAGKGPIDKVTWTIDLEAAVAELPAATQSVMTLRYGGELALTEIASVLEIPLGTVKSRLAYGLSSLRKRFRRNDGL